MFQTPWPLHDEMRKINKDTFPHLIWCGLNVTVLKEVTIGEGSVVGANSLVLHDLPDNVLAGGSPAKVIRTLKI